MSEARDIFGRGMSTRRAVLGEQLLGGAGVALAGLVEELLRFRRVRLHRHFPARRTALLGLLVVGASSSHRTYRSYRTY